MKSVGYWLNVQRPLEHGVGVSVEWSHGEHRRMWGRGYSQTSVTFNVLLGSYAIEFVLYLGAGASEVPHHADNSARIWQRKSGTRCREGGCSACWPDAGGFSFAPAIALPGHHFDERGRYCMYPKSTATVERIVP